MSSLLRYFETESAPLQNIWSRLEPSRLKPLYWYSIVKLSHPYRSSFVSKVPIPVFSTAWDKDKLKSQEKAIQAALILWVQENYRDTPAYLGADINSENVGYALSHEASKDEVRKCARRNAILHWAQQEVLYNSKRFMNAAAQNDIPIRCRFLFKRREGTLHVMHVPITVGFYTEYFVISLFQLKNGTCLLASSCSDNLENAVEEAIIKVYARYRYFQKARSGDELLLDKMEQQRIWLYATDEEEGQKAVEFIMKRQKKRERLGM